MIRFAARGLQGFDGGAEQQSHQDHGDDVVVEERLQQALRHITTQVMQPIQARLWLRGSGCSRR